MLPDFNAPDTLYLVDMSAFVHRFFHVGPPFAARNFTTMLEKLIANRAPARMAICEDLEWPTFRHELAPKTYKAGRPVNDKVAVLEQMRKAGEFIDDIVGARRMSAKGFEADDVIASLASWGVEEGLKVVIVGLDKDLTQLISSRVVMWDGKDKITGPNDVTVKVRAGVRAKVRPDQVVDFLTMAGDSTDNVPGIKGIGPVAAVEILERFGRLDPALDEANAAGPDRGANHPFFKAKPRLWAKLVASRAEANACRKLVKLRHDVPLRLESLDDLRLP
jgi:DNA polymerase-1